MSFKEKIYRRFQEMLQSKIDLLQQNLDSLFLSAQNETKRTAGDKHETALAMLQIEQENLRRQLHEAKIQQTVLQQINPAIIFNRIAPGALVKTSQGHFFISLALGKIREEDIEIISLSVQSPLGSKLNGMIPGDELTLNGRKYLIESIS
jgi:transcription elongation GreA/GreB family factor